MPPKKKQKGDDLESMSVKDLKLKCKECGVSQTGEKGMLIWRIKLYARGKDLTLDDGRSPFALKGDLKKIAAGFGVNPMGTNDELLEGLVAVLEKNTKKTTTSSGGSGTSPEDVARRVLALMEEDDFESILSLGSATPVTKATDTATLQKCYRRLSLVLHPDKLRNFEFATKAFQAVVTALERMTEPVLSEEAPKTKSKKIARTNENCLRTRVRCPRCREPWGESNMEGLPDWSYNLMMTGLRNWTCSTCLCEFGCVSALHECPKCGDTIDYNPDLYHGQVDCETCEKTFGFYQFTMSDRALTEAIAEARKTMEVNAKRRAAKRRRQARQEQNEGDDIDQETRFLLGLLDECPRCGTFFPSSSTLRDDKTEHLAICQDQKVIKKFKQKQADEKRKALAKEAQSDQQADIQAKAAWDASGAKTETMWMLPDSALAKVAGIDDTEGLDREDLLMRAAQRDNKLMLTNGEESLQKTTTFTSESLPSNYASLPIDALRAVCAAHGHKFPKNTSKKAILTFIEQQLDAASGDPKLLLEQQKPILQIEDQKGGGAAAKKKKTKGKKKKKDDSDSDDDDDSAYNDHHDEEDND